MRGLSRWGLGLRSAPQTPASCGGLWLPALLASLALGATVDGCSLGDVKPDACTGNAQCAATFGPGSTCAASGYCTDAASCTTGHDCRRNQGGGVCVNGTCQSTFPTDPACTQFTEPPGLLQQPAFGPTAPLVIGGIFSLAAAHDQALTDPIRLAVREINDNGGLNNGQRLGVVFCDNGGPGNTATGAARSALNAHALDYLAGTLGAPYIVGPLTSADAIDLIGDLTKNLYPTVLISPGATSSALTTIADKLTPSQPYGLFWRTCPNDTLQAQVLATNVIGKVLPTPPASVTVVYINDPYGLGLAASFQTDYTAGQVTLVPYEATTPMDPTALAQLATTANAAKGNAVLLIAEGGGVAVAIIEAMGQATMGAALASTPFFFTDGAMDSALLDPTLPTWVQTLLTKAQGTAPASPSGQSYDIFNTNLMTQFGISGTSASFLAEAYDAAYVGAYGVVYASKGGPAYDGIDVATGMAHLHAGVAIPLGAIKWTTGKDDLITQGQIDISGTSGPLQFDPATGEAPGPILVWGVAAGLKAFTQVAVVQP
jgi:branched-chain amino acid transport system substrate-binding protein